MFYRVHDDSPWQQISAKWWAIREEFHSVERDAVGWHEKKLHDGGWNVFGLFEFPSGAAIEGNVDRCPVTSDLIERWIPHHGAVGFSILMPGTVVRPHQGYQGSFLRAHLGLMIPAGDVGLSVAGEQRGWREGEWLVFDDRDEHNAWNLSDSMRVVLLIDFVPRPEDCITPIGAVPLG